MQLIARVRGECLQAILFQDGGVELLSVWFKVLDVTKSHAKKEARDVVCSGDHEYHLHGVRVDKV